MIRLRNLPRQFRLSLLFVTLLLSNLLIKLCVRLKLRIRKPARGASWSPGLSVVIPERAGADLLSECLSNLYIAAEKIGPSDPVEVVVVVNGSPRSDYADIARRFPAVRWLFHRRPLGFSSAVRRGVRAASHDWVYLLNNDMALAPGALKEILRWRGPGVFAVASQIFFTDPSRRREETGWTDMRVTGEGVEIFDVPPEDPRVVRGNLYAGGGASLFNRRVLRRLIPRGDPYHPFYWEDVEWGLRAWALGYEVLFCPESHCFHRHRATVSKFYGGEEVDQIFRRNGIMFELRNLLDVTPPRRRMQLLALMDVKTQKEMGRPTGCLSVLLARVGLALYPFRDMAISHVRRKAYLKPLAELGAEPFVVVVSPFAIYPVSHGGAVRINRLIREIGRHYNVVFLGDEEGIYPAIIEGVFNDVASAHLVGGRVERGDEDSGRVRRIETHSHPKLSRELSRLIHVYGPEVVQIEYVELAGLVGAKTPEVGWVLALHDVLLSGPGNQPDSCDRFESALIGRFDAVTVCSREDESLLDHPSVTVVPNGVDTGAYPYVQSAEAPSILFPGPFRYPPNLEGIRLFLKTVHPALTEKVPGLEVVILGGSGAGELAGSDACFRRKGVRLVGRPVITAPYLQSCALTVNPLYNIRGSSVKLVESIAAGRVCVSTRDGARGFEGAGFPGLVVVERVEDFLAPLEKLLLDVRLRRSLEPPPTDKLQAYTWERSGQKLRGALDRLRLGPSAAGAGAMAGGDRGK